MSPTAMHKSYNPYRVAPHLFQDVETKKGDTTVLWETLNCFPMGVLALDRNLYILNSNNAAKAVIDLCDGLHCYNGQLRAGSAHHTHLLISTVKRMVKCSDAGKPFPATLLRVPRSLFQRDLEMTIRSASSMGEGGKGSVAAIAFISDPARSSATANHRLEKLYRLTRSEAQLAAMLMQGKSLQEAAELLGVKKDTVRKHLQAVFSKTNTCRQGELIKLLLGGLAALEL